MGYEIQKPEEKNKKKKKWTFYLEKVVRDVMKIASLIFYKKINRKKILRKTEIKSNNKK